MRLTLGEVDGGSGTACSTETAAFGGGWWYTDGQ
jgi:hypothetical protein